MITQLYDPAVEICDIAVMYLEEVCKDPIKLEKVVAMRPGLEHLGDIGHPLFMQFVATSIGFEYLKDAQYIDRELDIWLSVCVGQAVDTVTRAYLFSGEESALCDRGGDLGFSDSATVLQRYCRGLLVRTQVLQHVSGLTQCRTYDGTAPCHFFGELTKTPEGCQFLRERGIVPGLAEIVRLHGLEPSNSTVLTSLKCALWALVGPGRVHTLPRATSC